MHSDRIVLAAAAAILFAQLMLPRVVGVASNGDFPRLLLLAAVYLAMRRWARHYAEGRRA